MSRHPVSDEVAATLGAFVTGGVGPRHSVLTRVFTRTGYASAAPYDSSSAVQQMTKEDRVRSAISAAVREPARARELVDGLLAEYRASRFFTAVDDPKAEGERKLNVSAARSAFARIDWELTESGELRPAGVGAVIAVKGRPAIEDQLDRLRRSAEDPALMLGTAKEMLESTAKYVLEAFSVPYSANMDFDTLWFHTRDRLGLHPKDVDVGAPGGEEVREILQASWSIARMTNVLRNREGTGHGRTLPTGVSVEVAHLIVREACSVVQLVLATLDRYLGR